MKKLRACILGATGIVGQHFIRILADHPFFEIEALTASPRSQGHEYGRQVDWLVSERVPEIVQEMVIQDTCADTVLRLDPDIVFSALPSGIASDIEAQLATAGLPVFSNTGAHRMDSSVPILIPEVNPDHLELIKYQDLGDGYIVTNSNCSTSGLVLALRPLMELGVRKLTVTTFQAVSGAGRRGVSSLDILGNVIPFITNEEAKIVGETKKILGTRSTGEVIPAPIDVNASCARVPVLDGHLESVVIDMDEPVSIDRVVELLENFTGEPQALTLPMAPSRPLVVLHENDRPQPKRDLSLGSGDLGMTVKLGRLRCQGNQLNMFLLVHNTIRGAAGASVLNAEFARAKGVLA
ncbi:MAG: aspartate-semialdehyde dehydrogenase [Candidatus Thorarchaeota archaeon]|nr:aspartate-semialdehyde dehydrogenase [Candidatus Thorarchaeota archaeon]